MDQRSVFTACFHLYCYYNSDSHSGVLHTCVEWIRDLCSWLVFTCTTTITQTHSGVLHTCVEWIGDLCSQVVFTCTATITHTQHSCVLHTCVEWIRDLCSRPVFTCTATITHTHTHCPRLVPYQLPVTTNACNAWMLISLCCLQVIHQIVKAVLSVFSPDKATSGEFNSWANCKQVLFPRRLCVLLQNCTSVCHVYDIIIVVTSKRIYFKLRQKSKRKMKQDRPRIKIMRCTVQDPSPSSLFLMLPN